MSGGVVNKHGWSVLWWLLLLLLVADSSGCSFKVAIGDRESSKVWWSDKKRHVEFCTVALFSFVPNYELGESIEWNIL